MTVGKIVTQDSTNGCEGCCFDKKKGHKECHKSKECFGHMREDKRSVIFKYKSVRV